MSISMHVVGIRQADEKWRAMKAVYDACRVAEIKPPESVSKFFGHKSPDNGETIVNLRSLLCCSKFGAPEYSGIEINTDLLPEGIKVIRVYNSW